MTSSSEDVFLEFLTTSTYWSSMTIGYLRISPAAGVTAMYCVHNLDISAAGPARSKPRHGHMPANAQRRLVPRSLFLNSCHIGLSKTMEVEL
jgi:hypothetical protein